MATLLERVLEAHGGIEAWRSAREISAEVRSGGLLVRTRFPGRGRTPFRGRIEVARPVGVVEPFPVPGRRGVFDQGEVRIETTTGETIARRTDPRSLFFGRSGLRRNLRWDPLDTAYFAGYALWNYLTTPYLFCREDVEVREGPALVAGGRRWERLDVSFPPGLDTHCPEQSFFFDEACRLVRHDYTAEVIGGFARAAHLCGEHRSFDGLLLPTRRRVRMRLPGGRALPGLAVVALDFSDVRVVR